MPSIAPKTSILGFDNAAHLLRRACYNPNTALIKQFATLSPQQALNQLFNYSFVAHIPLNDSNLTYLPTYYNRTVTGSGPTNLAAKLSERHWLFMASRSQTIEYRLTMWLHICFITADGGNYLNTFDNKELLRYHTKDNLKNLAIRITEGVQMLKYLDNDLNTSTNSNQNYAREFLELFTILKGVQTEPGSYTNYNEADIVEAAKILTGYITTTASISRSGRLNDVRVDPVTKIPRGERNVALHDSSNKTFSALFGGVTIQGKNTVAGMEEELTDYVNMIFNQPATATSYSRRLYRYFVGRDITPAIENDIIQPLALTLLTNNYNIEMAVKQLLTSQHFYDEDDGTIGNNTLGSLIKSPFDLIMDVISKFELAFPNYAANALAVNSFFQTHVIYFCLSCGFSWFKPENVNGYPGYSESPLYDKNFCTIGTLQSRYNGSIDKFLTGLTINGHLYKIDSALFVKNNNHFSNPASAETLVQEFYTLLFCSVPTGTRHQFFKNALLDGISERNWQTEWDNYVLNIAGNGAQAGLDKLISALVKSPEFQIM